MDLDVSTECKSSKQDDIKRWSSWSIPFKKKIKFFKGRLYAGSGIHGHTAAHSYSDVHVSVKAASCPVLAWKECSCTFAPDPAQTCISWSSRGAHPEMTAKQQSTGRWLMFFEDSVTMRQEFQWWRGWHVCGGKVKLRVGTEIFLSLKSFPKRNTHFKMSVETYWLFFKTIFQSTCLS